jgi:formamidopyrimidine-DNA glycosylase
MPELPEVETIRSGLASLLPGKTIATETHDWPKGFPNAPHDVRRFLVGSRLLKVRRRAKVLIFDLSSLHSLVVHLKMTGQLVFRSSDVHFGAGHPSDSLVGKLPDKSTRVTLTFKDGSKLFFNDQRKFGWMRLLPTPEVEQLDFFKKVGPEPLAANFTAQDFAACLNRRAKSGIKAVLLDQTVIAGVGNIYADESLWAAKIHPETKVQNIPSAQVKALYQELRKILQLSIKMGGSTDRNYVNHEGKKGSYLTFANVFRRQGQPCPRCQTAIIKMRVAGRGTHICPRCQRLKS